MSYVLGYLCIGIICTITAYIFNLNKEDSSFSAEVRALLRQPQTWQEKIADNLGLSLGYLFAVILWPAFLIFLLYQSMKNKNQLFEEDEPLLHCGPEHLLQQFTPLGAEQYIHIEYPPNYLVKGSFGHLEQAWINFLSQLETNDEIWSFLIPKDSQTHYYSRGAEGNIRGFAQIRDKKIINEFIYESD